MTRFRFNWEKAVQAIDFLAQNQPGITQYYVCKVIFFADREHILDYGRPISGDKFVAMEHGPVPSSVLNLLKLDSGWPDEILDVLQSRVVIETDGNKQHIISRGNQDVPALSGSDKEYLLAALQQYGHMSFGRLKQISHEDPAYEAAWEQPGNANEMNIDLWFDALDDPVKAKKQIEEYVKCSA